MSDSKLMTRLSIKVEARFHEKDAAVRQQGFQSFLTSVPSNRNFVNVTFNNNHSNFAEVVFLCLKHGGIDLKDCILSLKFCKSGCILPSTIFVSNFTRRRHYLQELHTEHQHQKRSPKMLQQILRDLYIDPALLAELGEDQKQILFCRMREEQVRRWRIWDSEQEKLEKLKGPKPERTPKVKFLEGSDGEPWTWVMGEHPDDKSIEQILEEEAREKARKLAEKEAKEFRKSVEAGLNEILDLNQKQIKQTVEEELNEILDMNQKQIQQLEAAKTLNRLKEKTPTILPEKDDPSEVYCSVDEIRKRLHSADPFENERNNATQKLNVPQYRNKVAATVAQWEKRVMEERTSQIFNRLQKKQLEAAKEAEDAEKRQELLWREQEKKAKEAEQQIREIARRAREEHKRTSCCEPEIPVDTETSHQLKSQRTTKEPTSMHVGVIKPRSREAITEWFKTVEVERRAAIDEKNQAAPWFHGLISRQEAENVLSDKPVGSFLVRISEKICGYAISYKDSDRCKHYLIDASNGHYQFLGANQMPHNTLGELISFHETQAITALGGELLRTPCRPSCIPAVFRGLTVYAAR